MSYEQSTHMDTTVPKDQLPKYKHVTGYLWANSWFMPHTMKIQYVQYCDKHVDGCMHRLWRQSSLVAVMKVGMVISCNQDRVVVQVYTIHCGVTQWLPLRWDEHVYPALLTWFISTSKQPEHELFTLHCDTKEKREEGWRGRWIWEKMSNIMQRNGREKGWVIEIRVCLTKTWKRGERI